MGVHGPAHRPAHLRRPRAPLLRIEPHDPRLDHHTPHTEATCGISLPPTVLALPGKRGDDLCTPAARVEPARSSFFPAAARSRSRAYPPRITTSFADCDLDLLEERLRPRIDTSSTVSGPARSDPEILTLITCHDATINIGKSRHKRCRTSIASTRTIANKQRGCSSAHIASAISHKIEIHQESAKGDTRTRCAAPFLRRANLQNPMCRQAFGPKGANELQFALSSHHSLAITPSPSPPS